MNNIANDIMTKELERLVDSNINNNKKYIEETLKAITDYVFEDRFNQAVLINGEWGSGKTHFIKNELIRSLYEKIDKSTNEDRKKEVVYLSLYGINTIEQFEKYVRTVVYKSKTGIDKEKLIKVKEIGENTYNNRDKLINTNEEKDKNNKDKKKEDKILNFSKFLEDPLINDLASASKKIKVVHDILSPIKEALVENIINKFLKDMIIIFDDLERCKVDIMTLLGEINNLVEHNNIKAILVANEKEIAKNDMNEQYNMIKEKTIGLTISFDPHVENSFEDILKMVTDEYSKVYSFVNANKKVITKVFGEYRNLRTLIRGLISFDKFYSVLTKSGGKLDEKDSYVKNEMRYILAYTFFKIKKVRNDELEDHFDMSNKENKGTEDSKDNTKRRKNSNGYWEISNEPLCKYGYDFVDDYLLNGVIREEKIIEVITEKIKKDKDRDLMMQNSKEIKECINDLEKWYELEDDEVKKLLDRVLECIDRDDFMISSYPTVIINLLYMEEREFEVKEMINKIIEKMKEKIMSKSDKVDSNIFNNELHTENDQLKSKYDRIMESLKNSIYTSSVKNYDWILKKDNWNNEFADKCRTMKIKDSKIASSFFEKNSESIIKEIKNANVVQICRFNDGVKELFDTGVIEKGNENLYSQLSYYDDELSQRVGNRNKRGAIEALVKTFEALEK